MRVIEISGKEGAAAYCGKLFRRWGAEVIKVEPPGRASPSTALDVYLNGGKRRTRLDAWTERDTLRVIAASADVLVTDCSPRELDALELHSMAPDVPVVVSITPFGLSGPYRDYEATPATLLALGGYTCLMGDKGRAPLTMPGNYVYYQAGTYAYTAALAALLAGQGAPAEIEVSILECLASLHQFTDTMWMFGEVVRSRHGNRWENLCPTTLLPCADGWYGLNILQNFWFPFAQMIGHPEMTGDHPYALNQGRMEDQDGIEEMITRTLWDTPKKQIFKDGQETWRVPVGYAASLGDMLDDPHLNQRGFWRGVELAGGTTVRLAGSAFRIAGEAAPPELAPLDPESSGRLSWRRPRHATPARGGAATAAQPLAGVRVLDLTRIWSGPLATRILGDLGAEVIKVESPDGRGPAAPRTRPGSASPAAGAPMAAGGHPWNRQPLFNKLNRNKQSIAIDLKAAKGRQIFLDLVGKSDVVIENFSARAMPGLGLSYDELRRENDQIIYVAMPAFGLDGPYRDYVGLGPSIEPVTGLTALMGYSDSEPRVTSKALTDAISGTAAASAVVTALWKRAERGHGFLIDLSQHETGIAAIGEFLVEKQLTGKEPERIGNAHPDFAPHGVYRCRGDDNWISLGVTADAQWPVLCRVLARPDLAEDPRFASMPLRLRHRAALDAEIDAATSAFDKLALQEALQGAGIAAGAVLSAPEYLSDEHLKARGYFVELTHPEAGRTAWDGSPLRFSGNRGHETWTAAPCLGAGNRALLADILGLSEEFLDSLYEQRVLAEAPTGA